jgi:hypothetical protein
MMIEARFYVDNLDGLSVCEDCSVELGEGERCPNCILYRETYCPSCGEYVLNHIALECLDSWVQQAIFPAEQPLKAGHRYAYSTQIAATWRAAMEMRARGWLVNLRVIPDGMPWRSNDPDPLIISSQMAYASATFMQLHDEATWRATARLYSPHSVFAAEPELALTRAVLAANAIMLWAKAKDGIFDGQHDDESRAVDDDRAGVEGGAAGGE